MWLGLISSVTIFFAVPAFAGSCLFSAAPPFQLSSDAVEWTMQIASGTTCTRGLKIRSTNIKDVKLIVPPESGKVDIKGPSFSYTAKADFRGQDEFTIQVSGTMVRIAGVSMSGTGTTARPWATKLAGSVEVALPHTEHRTPPAFFVAGGDKR